MSAVSRRPLVAQAWIETLAEDPAAVSALGVARARLPKGDEIQGLKRLRLLELHGELPARSRIEKLLHSSSQFYNPHQERCQVRTSERVRPPHAADHALVAVTERGGERQLPAERWWLHETGTRIQVWVGVVWAFALARGAATDLESFVVLTDRHHGLFCNPRSQHASLANGKIPLSWIGPGASASDVVPNLEVRA